jgi:pimeloyl-ACP methyl ester carboxylesterase
MNRRTFLNIGVASGVALLAGSIWACTARHASAAEVIATSASAFVKRRKYLVTAYGDIAYVDVGSGPAALFLHGFPLNSFQWRDAIQSLAPYRRCLAPDFLGLGYTRVGDGVSMKPVNQVAMLIAFLDKLGIDKVDVVGNDSGGAVAQLLAVHHPERIRSVLLTNCDTEIECPPKAMNPVIELAGQNRFAEEWLLPWWKDPNVARTPEGFGGMCYADPSNPTNEAVATYFTPLVQSAELRHRTNQFASALARNSLEGIGPALKASRIPMGVVWGTADSIFSIDGLHYLTENIGNLRFAERLDGYKLFWPEERPDVIRDQALRLWKARCQ